MQDFLFANANEDEVLQRIDRLKQVIAVFDKKESKTEVERFASLN